jgi:4-carboxymuconolactone decarboxylase
VAALQAVDAHYADFVAGQAAVLWNRAGLSHRERAYLSLAADVCLGTLDGPFRLHLALALASGATREQVRDALRFLAEFGAPKVWGALERFEDFLATR